LNLPEDEGVGLGLRLTRTLWDPYPWIHEVTSESRADIAGLRAGDCLLQADGKDLLGLSIGKVAGLIRGDGEGRGVSLLVWNCGVDPRDDPELLWSCGGGSRGEKSRRALTGVVKALSCCVCAATATKALNCARSHLYCEGCWSRLERCALCREPLPPKDSPYSRNLVAEQVFEAIATEYEIKYTLRRPQSTSAHTSPNRSPNISPTARRKGQYHLSMMHRNRKPTIPNEKFASDPNINRFNDSKTTTSHKTVEYPGNSYENGGKCKCQINGGTCKCGTEKTRLHIPQINIEDTSNNNCSCSCQQLQHKLVARLRQACSLADLQNVALQSCSLSKSLNNICQNEKSSDDGQHSNSMDNLKNTEAPVFVVSPPPIYLLACEHSK
ncbi:jg4390, partial [Pararge aegeria aegeria]